MFSELKKNHRYLFFKQLPNSNQIKSFRANLVSVCDMSLLVNNYDDDEIVVNNRHCVVSMPSNWIIKAELISEEILDHNEIFTEILVLD